MNDLVRRVLHAYRPLYMRGLLMDGQYRLPTAPGNDGPPAGAGSDRSHCRVSIAALVAAAPASLLWLPGSHGQTQTPTSSDGDAS